MITRCTRARDIFQPDILLNTNTLHRTSSSFSKARIIQDDFDFSHTTTITEKATLMELAPHDVSFARVIDNPLPKISRPDELRLSFPSTFDHSTQLQNSMSSQHNQQERTFRSTGTTICGCLAGSFVILGADTRATDDRIVADKRCEKIHKLARNIYACGAGTSADLDMVTRQVEYRLRLQDLQEISIGNDPELKTEPSVSGACRMLRDTLYEGGGDVGATLIVGGHEGGRASLVSIHPHGSMDVVPFSALGSGGLAAMAVLEQGYHPNLTLEAGKALIKRAVTAGIQNDLGSGSQVDLLVLGPNNEVVYERGAIPEEQDDVQQQVQNMLDGQGVNGFGNTPYYIKSSRIFSDLKESTKAHEWKSLLDL